MRRAKKALRRGADDFMAMEGLRVSAIGVGRGMRGIWERLLRLGRGSPKRLRLCESLPLGERRFVAVVEFEAERFLVGGTPSSVVLLSRLAEGHEPQGDAGDIASNPGAAAQRNRPGDEPGNGSGKKC
jgi:hypothetical protein